MLSELSISPDPSAVLVNPTCSTFINSLSIFRISAVNIDPIPLKANWDVAAPILPSKVCVIDVNVIGCWVTPSNPIIVFVSCWVIVNLCALPAPTPVNVIAVPAVISPLVGNNWNAFSSLTLTKTVEGNISVVTPAKFTVDAIDTGVAAIPTKVDASSYVISSLVLKKWLGIVNIPVLLSRPTVSVGLNVFWYIGTPSCFRSNVVLFALFPFLPSNEVTNTFCWTGP